MESGVHTPHFILWPRPRDNRMHFIFFWIFKFFEFWLPLPNATVNGYLSHSASWSRVRWTWSLIWCRCSQLVASSVSSARHCHQPLRCHVNVDDFETRLFDIGCCPTKSEYTIDTVYNVLIYSTISFLWTTRDDLLQSRWSPWSGMTQINYSLTRFKVRLQ